MWLLLLTTGVGAVQGAVLGRRSGDVRADLMGLFVFALLLGLGGGLVRDVLLGNTPVMAVRTPWYLVTVLVGGILVIVAGRWIPVEGRVFTLLDALTLGLYAAIGTRSALDFEVSVIGAVVVGMMAALSGGVMVSILRRETPRVIQPGPPYAALALGGIVMYLVIAEWNAGLASFACVAFVVVGRFVTIRYRVQVPSPRPLP